MAKFPLKKIISSIIILMFLCSDFVLAEESKSFFKNKKPNYQSIIQQNENIVTKKRAILDGDEASLQNPNLRTSQTIDLASVKDISDIHIPQELGSISEVYNAPVDEGRRIIHFQDLHTQYDAQKNSARIIEHLYKTYNIDMVLSEGAFGRVEPGIVKQQITDKPICQRVAKLLLKMGEITGEEYLGIIKDYPIAIWGVENKDLYYKNVGQYNKLISNSENAQVFLSQVEKAVTALKPVIYNKDIKELEEKEALYNDKKIDLNVHLDYLTQCAKKFNLDIAALCQNISLVQQSVLLEKTWEPRQVSEELRLYSVVLTQELTNKGRIKESEEFNKKLALFNQEKISAVKFYAYMKGLGENLSLPIAKYRNLSNFTDYLNVISKIESYKIYTEMTALTQELKYRSCSNEGQKNLITAAKNNAFLKDFFNLKVSNEEIEDFMRNKDKYTVGYFKQVLTTSQRANELTGKTEYIDYNPEIIDNNFQELIDFYNVVWQRDEAIVANTLKRMTDAKESNSILIVGGFHTKGMMKMFRDKGISYVVLSANSGKEMNDELYHSLLAGKNWTLKELIPLSNEITKDSLRIALPTDIDNPEAFLKIENMLPLLTLVVAVSFGKNPESTIADLKNTTKDLYNNGSLLISFGVANEEVERALDTVKNISVKKSGEVTYVALGDLGYFKVNEKGVATVIERSEFDNIQTSVEVAEAPKILSGGDEKPIDDGTVVPEHQADIVSMISLGFNGDRDLWGNPDDVNLLPRFADISNELKDAFINNKVTIQDVERFHKEAIQRALKLPDVNTAKAVQIIARQSLTIINWIGHGVKGAEGIEVTADPAKMVKSNKGASYLNKDTIIFAGLVVVDGEGEQGYYFRGAEGLAKMGPLDDPSVAGVKLGSELQLSTGKGHFQGNSLDVKYVTTGRALQFNVRYNEKGIIEKRPLVQEVREGEWALALPGYVDFIVDITDTPELSEEDKDKIALYVMNHGFIGVSEALKDITSNKTLSTLHETDFIMGGLSFNDFSIKLSDDEAKLLNSHFDPSKNKAISEAFDKIKSAPYSVVKKGDTVSLVKHSSIDTAQEPVWIKGPTDFLPTEGLIQLYTGLTVDKLRAEIINPIIKSIAVIKSDIGAKETLPAAGRLAGQSI